MNEPVTWGPLLIVAGLIAVCFGWSYIYYIIWIVWHTILDRMWTLLDWTIRKIPNDRTRSLLGIVFITLVGFGCVMFLKTFVGE